MERKHNDLWVGGPWEQPSRPVVNPPHIPKPQRPVLRVRKKRRSPLKIFLIVLAILAAIAVAVIAAGLNGFFPIVEKDFGPYDPDDFPFPFPYHEYEFQEEMDYTTPPSIPASPTGTGVTIELHSGEGAQLSYEEIYNTCAPSIVSITATGRHGGSTGTGIILTADGYLLTNAHVVAGASQVEVVTFENHMADAALVGFDADEDLAVLKVELDGLTPARFGIPEPDGSCPALANSDFARALILVPALAFDENGYRLGYGGGYYDRFLARFGGVTVGLVYRDLLFDNLPKGYYDRKVKLIISESGVLLTSD